jgi:hypothetical protein
MNPAVRYFAQMEKEKYTARSKDMRNVLDAHLSAHPALLPPDGRLTQAQMQMMQVHEWGVG